MAREARGPKQGENPGADQRRMRQGEADWFVVDNPDDAEIFDTGDNADVAGEKERRKQRQAHVPKGKDGASKKAR